LKIKFKSKIGPRPMCQICFKNRNQINSKGTDWKYLYGHYYCPLHSKKEITKFVMLVLLEK